MKYFLSAFLLFLCCANCQAENSQSAQAAAAALIGSDTAYQKNAIQQIIYRCPPCGCLQDETIFPKQYVCPDCSMTLIAVSTGTESAIFDWFAPVFMDGAVSLLYSKLIYPVIMVALMLSLFLSVLRFKRETLNIFLCAILLVISLYGFKIQLYGIQESLTDNVKSLFYPISFITMLGPLLFFYVRSLLETPFKWKNKYYLHFTPALFFFIYYTLVLLSPQQQQNFLVSPYEAKFSHLEQVLAVVVGLLYAFQAYKLFISTKKSHANRNRVQSAWLNRFLLGMIGLLVIWGAIILLNFSLYQLQAATSTYNILWIAFGVFLIWIAMEVLVKVQFDRISRSSGTVHGHRISDTEVHKLKLNLEELMRERKLFLDQNLKLNKLAEDLNINPRYLSGLLNNSMQVSFHDYVNSYRVQESQKLLKSPANTNLTIEAIANLAGFKSKSSFNAAFKKFTGMTPKKFMKQAVKAHPNTHTHTHAHTHTHTQSTDYPEDK